MPPGLEPDGDSAPTYADKLKTNVKWDHRLKRNVLQITLETINRDAMADLDHDCIAKLFKTLGIDVKNQVEGYFIKNSAIFVYMPSGISLERFCKDQNFNVTNGVKTGFIRPAGMREVVVTIKGLDWNTPDSFVIEYLSKFGVVKSSSVIYDKYREGPFAGKLNGDRKYQVDFSKSSRSMGTFHIIDGSKVQIFYAGNRRTCGRCHQTSENCPGDGIAKKCDDNHGDRVSLISHMKKLWDEIGFIPRNFELDVGEDEEDVINDVPIKESTNFSPKINKPEPTAEEIGKYQGVCIKNFPKKLELETIVDFLKQHGLPEDITQDEVAFGDHGNITIENLSSDVCLNLLKNVHFKNTKTKFFDRPIYCNPIANISPIKNDDKNTESQSSEKEESSDQKTSNKKESKTADIKSKLLQGDSNSDSEDSDDEVPLLGRREEFLRKEDNSEKHDESSFVPAVIVSKKEKRKNKSPLQQTNDEKKRKQEKHVKK